MRSGALNVGLIMTDNHEHTARYTQQ